MMILILLSALSKDSIGQLTTLSFSSSGTWTAPPGVTSVTVQCWGGGGAGGGALLAGVGGGGKGGGFASSILTNIVPGNTYTVTVGASGVGSTGAGGNGGPSWFSSTSTVYAVGGNGGGGGTALALLGAGATGPTTGNIGTTNFYGGNGVSGYTTLGGALYNSGGGGGGAGTTHAGSNGSNSTGGAGGATGGGAGGNGRTNSSAGNGATGSSYGGGGGGAISLASTPSGGAGGAGEVILTYTIPPPTITVGAISGSPFCATASPTTSTISISVPITISGIFTSGNTFEAQLSNASGSFAIPILLGSLPLSGTIVNSSTTISGNIPIGTVDGTGYLIRVTGSAPTTTSTNTIPITIFTPQQNSIAPNTAQTINTINPGNGTLLTVTDGSGVAASSHQWYYGTSSSGPFNNPITGAIGTTYTPSNSTFSTANNYWVVCVSNYSCNPITSNAVEVTAVTPSIATGTLGVSPTCLTPASASAISVTFTSIGIYSAGNTYTAQLSNASGSFASPVNIGTLTSSSNSGTISATIPIGTAPGSGYLIRVISSSPAVTGSANGPITINNNSIAPTSNQSFAAGASGVQLTVTDQPVTASSWQWYWSSNSGAGPYNAISGANSSTYTPTNINNNIASVYYIVCVSTFACGTLTSNQVQITVTPGSLASLQISPIASPQSVDVNFTPSFTITGMDIYGNLVNGGSVNITYSGGTSNSPSITLGSNGTSILSNFAVLQPGTNVTLTASSAANNNVFEQSNTFNVNAFASSSGDYFRNNSALATNSDWSSVSIWQGSHDGSNWFAATAVPTNTALSILIQPQAAGIVTVSTNTITGTNITVTGELDINSGGSLTLSGTSNLLSVAGVVNINSGGTLSNAGTGTITSSAVTMFAKYASTYQHAVNGGTIPVATWDPNSTCLVSGITSIAPSGLGQSFGNFTWNSNLTGNVNLNSTLTTVLGSFSFSPSSSTGILSLATNAALALNIGGNFVLSAATGPVLQLTSGSASPVITISGMFSHSGGTLDFGAGSSTGTINVTGNVTLSGTASIIASDANKGAINFSGTTQNISSSTSGSLGYASFSVNSGSTTTLQTNLALSHGSSFNILNGGTLIASGENTISDDGTGSYTQNVSGTLQIGSASGISASGNSGNIQTATRNFNAAANYSYNGASAQVTGTGLPATLTGTGSLTINNSSGISLTQPTAINGTGSLNLTNGVLTTNTSSIISLGSSASANLTVSDYTNPAYVDGPIQKTGLSAFTFPVGQAATGYVPIGIGLINGTSINQTFTAQYIHTSAETLGPVGASTPQLVHASSCDYWRLDLGSTYTSTITNNSLPAGVSVPVILYWNQNNGSNCVGSNGAYVNNMTTLAIGHLNVVSGQSYIGLWNPIGMGSYNTSGTTTAGSISYAGTSTFSPFTLGTTDGSTNPLEIILNYFKATKANGNNALSWQANCTSPTAEYILQRSSDGANFSDIDSIQAATATECSLPYNFNDYTATGSRVYYRLEMIDQNGKISISQIELILNDANTIQLMNVKPNPVQTEAWLNISASENQNVELVIFSIDGKQLVRQTINVVGGMNTIDLHTLSLASGMYIVRGVFMNGQTNTLTFVKQ
jgi:hypothetical protein